MPDDRPGSRGELPSLGMNLAGVRKSHPFLQDIEGFAPFIRKSYAFLQGIAGFAPFIWGFAEATLFFIVPDVLLSWIALNQPRRAWVACGWAVAGALVGGTLIYVWGAVDVDSALTALEHVPAVSPAMCEAVGEQIHTRGIGALFLGPITGTPFKIYAVQAGARQINLALFLLVSVPARLIRFALVTGLTILILRLFPRTPVFVRRMVHIVLWAMFYGWYFWRLGMMS